MIAGGSRLQQQRHALEGKQDCSRYCSSSWVSTLWLWPRRANLAETWHIRLVTYDGNLGELRALARYPLACCGSCRRWL
jgi:hypothetical protein